MSDHLLRFRILSTEDLLTKRTALEAQDSIYQQQTIGTKSMTRDLRFLTDQLNAIAFVLRERGSVEIIAPALNIGVGVTDFSGVK